jgi:hypothetical protein
MGLLWTLGGAAAMIGGRALEDAIPEGYAGIITGAGIVILVIGILHLLCSSAP